MRLYVVVRSDLSPAQQAVQGMHAVADFAAAHPEPFQKWQGTSNTLVFLAVDDESDVEHLFIQLAQRQDEVQITQEPDIGNQATAVAFLESEITRPWTKGLPRALQV